MDSIRVRLKGMYSPDLNRPEMPDDPECCAVLMIAEIGSGEGPAADQFSFHAVTAKFLVLNPESRWGNGYLLLAEFSWTEIERMLQRLVSGVKASSWPDAAEQLGKYLDWEYEGYNEGDG